ncbi:hypothetical protein AB0B01_12445 [Streptomyces sp. NPDC044571]|uniref:hypothetical protein n=1 Tax=Streptomyces sp. NPDC044571 TaxID=3155371 RepID=UPI0033CE98E5
MPARWSPVDPSQSELEAFASDLRKLGRGKASVAYIADSEPRVSRAALYAALSGRRLPKRKTVSTLLRWWIPTPPVRTDGGEPDWEWIYGIKDSETAAVASNWMERHSALLDQRQAWPANRRAPVLIAVPPEQQRFIEKLRETLEKYNLLDGVWDWDDYEQEFATIVSAHNVERYLTGRAIPTDDTISRRLLYYVPDAQMGGVLFDLVRLAQDARRARVRSRRLARGTAT